MQSMEIFFFSFSCEQHQNNWICKKILSIILPNCTTSEKNFMPNYFVAEHGEKCFKFSCSQHQNDWVYKFFL